MARKAAKHKIINTILDVETGEKYPFDSIPQEERIARVIKAFDKAFRAAGFVRIDTEQESNESTAIS